MSDTQKIEMQNYLLSDALSRATGMLMSLKDHAVISHEDRCQINYMAGYCDEIIKICKEIKR